MKKKKKKTLKRSNYNYGSIWSVFFHVASSYAWENSRHSAIPPLVSARNDLWGTSVEIPYYPDLDSASDWWKQISHAPQPIRSTNQIWEAKRHQYGIFALVSQTPTSFRRETSGGVGGNVGWFHRLQIYWNKRKSGSAPTGSVWDTKIAVLRFFWDSIWQTKRHVKTPCKRLGNCLPTPSQ